MSTTIHEVLDELRASALDERDKGDRFERLMQGYFRTDPQWVQQFSDIWLWSEWPGREDRPDTGIDLVARERDSDRLTAIQCKFYAQDTSIQRSHIDSFFTASGRIGFTRRIVVSTSDRWSKNAEDALADQQVYTQRLDVSYLSESTVDWSEYSLATPSVMPTHGPKQLRPHQAKALEAVRAGLTTADRGKLIMACGTGKTFTSLNIAEDVVGAGGSVLFLVPSIHLLSLTLREWVQDASLPLRPFAVCSDVRAGRRQNEDMSTVDLAEPATTSGETLMQRIAGSNATGRMTVVFSTYQSIQAIADAQVQGLGEFDLVVCDEAHRTTGVTVAGEDGSAFVQVHDSGFLRARKRLYMTATPRLYDDGSKSKAAEGSAVLASMDDESLYGPELHRLGFGEAVEAGLLSDYKVLVLAVDEKAVSAQFQSQLADDNSELSLDDAAKLVGCWNGLAKRDLDQGRLHANAVPMRRAVAFAENIKASKKVAALFEVVSDQLAADSADEHPLDVQAEHVDGTYNVLRRNALLDWLKAAQPDGSHACRVLSNARCLSEGVDVPALDAVLFLNPRNSVVDVVQSVGRVMRRAPGKEYGYVILPIGIPADVPPEQALSDNRKYRVVWQVLQALRAHDDRFNAMVNKIELNRARDDKLQVIGVPSRGDQKRTDGRLQQGQLALSWSDEWRDAIYAKVVAKVGERRYWETWAADIARIAEQHTTRIRALLDDPALDVGDLFHSFLAGLRHNLNDSISRANAIEMLAQHLVTRPVFDALFEGYDFAVRNPVSIVMEDMLEALDEQGIDKDSETLDRFYASVRMRAAGIDNAEGKQRIVTELYERFFKTAFPKAAASLGIVYTPVEVVDFMVRGVQHVLETEFGSSLSDEGVHVLDPFTGTGTFIVRLLQSGFIGPDDLLRKYTSELHANEINLLAYYIAAVNIEATYHGIAGDYRPFEGIVLADTFQIHEADDTMDELIFPRNNERVVRQKATDIRVVIANPPYSVGQDSANDDNANLKYPTLDARIESTYARRSTATNKNSLYDSYIRAIRWASDRVADRGVVCFVSNGGYVDGNTADGLRQCLVDDFDRLYVYNLRGNQRTSGEQSRREGGKVFGAGSRATIAILLAVKTGLGVGATLRYRDIGDNLTREQKLDTVDQSSLGSREWQTIAPNEHGDWINQRRDDFSQFTPIWSKDSIALFARMSPGLQSNRDAWVYNYSSPSLRGSVRRMTSAYNEVVASGARVTPDNETVIKWSSSLVSRLHRRRLVEVTAADFRVGFYRPFDQQHVCVSDGLIHRPGKLDRFFPTAEHQNLGFYCVGAGSDKAFALLATDVIPDLAFWGSSGGQFFPRWTYEPRDGDGLFASGDAGGYARVDNITDAALQDYRATYGAGVSKDDIFYYVYGLLHSPTYRTEFSADLKKMLPRIPKVTDFAGFTEAGRRLADLHVGYESVEPYPLDEQVSGAGPDAELYRVQKMTFAGKGKDKDRSRLVYNSRITLSGIPAEAYRYLLGSRSALEWVMDRYQVHIDKASRIVNNPNDWATEHEQPRYIVDLLGRVVSISIETMRIVDHLPPLDIVEQGEQA